MDSLTPDLAFVDCEYIYLRMNISMIGDGKRGTLAFFDADDKSRGNTATVSSISGARRRLVAALRT
jgi:hypothetical protein